MLVLGFQDMSDNPTNRCGRPDCQMPFRAHVDRGLSITGFCDGYIATYDLPPRPGRTAVSAPSKPNVASGAGASHGSISGHTYTYNPRTGDPDDNPNAAAYAVARTLARLTFHCAARAAQTMTTTMPLDHRPTHATIKGEFASCQYCNNVITLSGHWSARWMRVHIIEEELTPTELLNT